jgi:hypothetical protein
VNKRRSETDARTTHLFLAHIICKELQGEADKFRGVYNHKPGGRIRLRDVMEEADLRPHISGSTRRIRH